MYHIMRSLVVLYDENGIPCGMWCKHSYNFKLSVMLFKNNHCGPYIPHLYFIAIKSKMEPIILIVLTMNCKYWLNRILLTHNNFESINLTRILLFLISLKQPY